jgi:hypothetical protein
VKKIPVLVLVAALFAACSNPSGDDPGSSPGNPVHMTESRDLSGNGWAALLSEIQSAGKYVALDLSACPMDDTEFNPGASGAGKTKIVSLVLPDEAERIKAGADRTNPTFKRFTALTEVRAAAVTDIGDYAFNSCTALTTADFPKATSIGEEVFANCTSLTTASFPEATHIGEKAFASCPSLTTASFPEATSIGDYGFGYCTSLETASFPEATSIGDWAFDHCPALTTADFPLVTSIGNYAFAHTGSQMDLTITLGSTTNLAAPKLGTAMFAGVRSTKTVTVQVPSGASGYGMPFDTTDTTANNWGNAFRGKGWNSEDGYLSGGVNANITLAIVYQ